jgi:glutathione synthase/RimK-type ligase-like ATP-grasp enzyme
MNILIVVNTPSDWPLRVPHATVVPANEYISDRRYTDLANTRVFNLCRSYRYQSIGYYVSLLAAARGHKPIPNVNTIQDVRSRTVIRSVSDELHDLLQKSFASITSNSFTLSIYFGHNPARRYDRLSTELFNLFQAPFLRAEMRRENDGWEIASIHPISANEIPESHREFAVMQASRFFAGHRTYVKRRRKPRYDLAILWNRDDHASWASDEAAIRKFERAAMRHGMDVEIIGKDEFAQLAEFDALFIRETTSVMHYTYRFARRAEAEGLVVIDDPTSILRCTNKVYLAELLERHDIPTPKTLIVNRDNIASIPDALGFPCVLKQPDSAFSQGVVKIETRDQLQVVANCLLDESDLLIAQEFIGTPFDWRIGIIDRKPIYACKYFMARRHWQIINPQENGATREGRVETLPIELAPRQVVRTALRAANLIGDGLYGVDLKQVGRQIYVIEVNDNPSIEAGYEDRVLKDELYDRIMAIFLNRLDQLKLAHAAP